MKKIPLMVVMILGCVIAARSQNAYLVNSAGTYISTDSNVIVLNNTSLVNSGSVNINSKIVFTGSQLSTVGGGNLSLKNISVNKAAAVLVLTSDIATTGSIHFIDGLLDVNMHTANLGATGLLSGESETAHITGINGGSVIANASDINSPASLNVGNLGALVSSSQGLGSVSISRYHKPFDNAGNGAVKGIQRSYFIQPANNSFLNATLRFYYLDTELNGKDEDTLSLWQSNDGVDWINLGADVKNTTDNFVEKRDISSLSWFTLTGAGNALPVKLVSFKATCYTGYTLLQWQTANEVNASSFIIEKSSEGRSWTALQTIVATNATNGSSYSYNDGLPQAIAYYRIQIKDKSSTTSYSPVFGGGCSEITRPIVVYPNPAHSTATVSFAVRQNGDAMVQLYALNGQLLYSRKQAVSIGANNIVLPVVNLAAGIYSVKLFINGQTLEAKLVKD